MESTTFNSHTHACPYVHTHLHTLYVHMQSYMYAGFEEKKKKILIIFFFLSGI